MYAVLNSKGDIFIASDIKRIRGNKLVFRDRWSGRICGTYGLMKFSDWGEIYNPGNSQFVAIWKRDKEESLCIRCFENNGNLRQLINGIFHNASYLRTVKHKGMELVTVKWRKAGSEELYEFKDIIEIYKKQYKRYHIIIVRKDL